MAVAFLNTLRLAWFVASQGNAMHDASEPVVIINRIVLGTAIVPEGKGTLSPAKTRGEFRLDLVFEEVDE